MFLRRQISASLACGEKETLADGYKFPYKLIDVLPKYVLALDEGKVSSGYIELFAGTAALLQLPESYVSPAKLSVILRSTVETRVTVVSAVHGSSVFLINSTNTAEQGAHYGMLMWQGAVTSVTVDVPALFADSLIEYFMFEIPDLDIPESYQIGSRAIGYVTNT